MEIRNSAAVYIGMKEAKKDGVSTFLTGDACDELFAGYSFLFNLGLTELKASLRRLWSVMAFSAIPMAESLGMVAKIPFLDPEVRQLASRVDPSFLVVEQEGQKWGKWIVRKAFEDLLPSQITWRVKTPIEYGCGTTTLPQIFDKRISDEEFHEKQQRTKEIDNVSIRDKEHLAYYEIFHRVFGTRPEANGRTCPGCQYEVREDATFCRTCGAYPI
jgi:asparagine synthase (glutamine-hydrolysing)